MKVCPSASLAVIVPTDVCPAITEKIGLDVIVGASFTSRTFTVISCDDALPETSLTVTVAV